MGSTSALAGQHIVLVGNPGVGKSAILNCTIGVPHFESGLSLAKGLTTAVDTKTFASVTYSDTPGLDDSLIREKAAREISTLLREGGTIKLVFVITLESGRLRSIDIQTMRIVLDAIHGISPDRSTAITKNRFSVIVNKCEPNILRMLQTNLEQRGLLEGTIGVGSSFKYIGYMQLVPGANDSTNHLLGSNDKVVEFFRNAPDMTIAMNNNIKIDVSDYDSRLRQLEETIATFQDELRAAIEDSKNGRPFSRRLRNCLNYLMARGRAFIRLM